MAFLKLTPMETVPANLPFRAVIVVDDKLYIGNAQNEPQIIGAGFFTYIAYADDSDGTGFTTTFDSEKDYIAIRTSEDEIETPEVSDFTGLWKKYKGEKGDTGEPVGQWQGAWSAGTYESGDIVSHSDELWIALVQTTEEPSGSASDWVVFTSFDPDAFTPESEPADEDVVFAQRDSNDELIAVPVSSLGGGGLDLTKFRYFDLFRHKGVLYTSGSGIATLEDSGESAGLSYRTMTTANSVAGWRTGQNRGFFIQPELGAARRRWSFDVFQEFQFSYYFLDTSENSITRFTIGNTHTAGAVSLQNKGFGIEIRNQRLFCLCGDVNVTEVDTGIDLPLPPPSDTVSSLVMRLYPADRCEFFINDELIETITTNIPIGFQTDGVLNINQTNGGDSNNTRITVYDAFAIISTEAH